MTKYITIACTLFVLALTKIAVAQNQSGNQRIQITQLNEKHLDDGNTKVIITAKGHNVKIGSFFIRVESMPEGASMPGTFENQGYRYVNGGSVENPTAHIIDNSKIDGDSREGVFAYTFNIKSWPDGRYYFLIGADNRPATGPYLSDARAFVVNKGVPALAKTNIPSAVNRVVYQKDNIYAVFPDLFILPDGKMGTSFGTRARRSHIDPTGGSLSLISNDQGQTWTKATEPLVDKRWQTKSGSLVTAEALGWIYTDASKEAELRKEHKVLMNAQPGKIAYLGGAQFRTSSDGGKTWKTQEIKIPENCVGLMNHHAYATYLVTEKGVRLRAIYGRRFDPKTNTVGKDEEFFLRSTDDGKSWTCYPMYPSGLPDPKVGFNETAIAQAADGTIVAMMRSTEQDYLWEATSKDDGLTWSAPVKTPIWGFPADLIRLKDGRLLCSYGYRRAPMGIRASLSSDNGKTWDVAHELILRQDGFGNPGDLGYPLAYQLPDGSIFTIYYITTDGQNTHVASTTYELPKP